MNMFKPVGAKSAEEYVAMLAPERREEIEELDRLLRESVPEQARWFAYNMLGYGKFTYVDYGKKENQWPVIALAS